MRSLRPFRSLLTVLAVTAFCALDPPSAWDAFGQTAYAAQAPYRAFVRWRDSRPPRVLPLRPGDCERYPRRGFGLVLETAHGFRVDTFAGTATKDLVFLPDTTINLRLSEAQLDTLYDAAIRMRIFQYTEPHPQAALTFCLSDSVRLLVRAGGATRRLAWSAGDRPREPTPDEWKRLMTLAATIGRMVRAHPAYRALPPPKGVYID